MANKFTILHFLVAMQILLASIFIFGVDGRGGQVGEQKWEEKTFSKSAVKGKTEKLLMWGNVLLLAQSPDNAIYRAKPIEWPEGKKEKIENKDVVIKIVHFQMKDGYVRKEFEMLAHEVEMLKLAKLKKSKNVVDLYESQILNESVYMVIELGESDLSKTLGNLSIKWEESTQNEMLNDIHQLILDLAKALRDFHRFGIHLAMKPGNWLYAKNVVKLIDLQTAIPSDKGKWDKNYWKYACKTPNKKSPNNYRAPILEYASPEHQKFCSQITKEARKKDIDPKNFSTMTDIWSFGVLICEILENSPKIKKAAENRGWKWQEKMPHNGKIKDLAIYEIISRTFSYKDSEKWTDENKRISANIRHFLAHEFPQIYVLLENIFQLAPGDRPTAQAIEYFMENFLNVDINNEKEMDIHKIQNVYKRVVKWESMNRKESDGPLTKIYDYLVWKKAKMPDSDGPKLVIKNVDALSASSSSGGTSSPDGGPSSSNGEASSSDYSPPYSSDDDYTASNGGLIPKFLFPQPLPQLYYSQRQPPPPAQTFYYNEPELPHAYIFGENYESSEIN